nr:uncharacterized protein LOC117987875 [Maniola hyperantus]
MRATAHTVLISRWKEDLQNPIAGTLTVEAIQPQLERWLKRRHGTLTYRLVQVLTGHGCFGKYLHQIARREVNPACHECGAPSDTAQHTLMECAAWAPQRHLLSFTLGSDLSLPSVISAMITSETCWTAVVSFCEQVLALKEAAERERELDPNAHPIRRKRQGQRRRRYAHHLGP